MSTATTLTAADLDYTEATAKQQLNVAIRNDPRIDDRDIADYLSTEQTDQETWADEQDDTSVLQTHVTIRPSELEAALTPPKKRGRPKNETTLVKAITEAELRALAKQKAIDDAAELQKLVPWKVIPKDPNNYLYNGQKREIDQWADDNGKYPTRYRSYTRKEWTQAIDLLAACVEELTLTDPDYQRLTGLYVEEFTEDILLIKAKKWQLQIQVPTKATVTGKKFVLQAAPGHENWNYREEDRCDSFADLLTEHVPTDARDVLLDICAQYLRPLRIRVNKKVFVQEHPELADHVNSAT